MAWSVRLALAFVLLAIPAGGAAAQGTRAAAPTHIGVALDGPSEFTDSLRSQFAREILTFFGTERTIDFPPGATLRGDWTTAGVNAAIDRLLADPGVDIVLTLGPMGSNELAHRKRLAKPSIAALIIDPGMQDLPQQAASTGVRNLSYVNVSYSATRTVPLFHDIVPFRRLVVLIHPGLLGALPAVRERAAALEQALDATITFVPVTTSAAEALRALPAGTDAVYVTPLEQLPTPGLDSLISGLIVRRLPSFAYVGRNEVERRISIVENPALRC